MPYDKDADKYHTDTSEQEMNSFAQHKAMTEAIDKKLVLVTPVAFPIYTIWMYLMAEPVIISYINRHPGDIAIYRKQLVRNYLRDKLAAYLNTLE